MSGTVSRDRPSRSAARSHRSYVAFLGHRLSGLALAMFLPLHFLMLSLALSGPEALDAGLAFAELPLVKLAEWGLVLLLGLHFFFGLRLLIVELLPWRGLHDDRAALIGWGAAASLVLGMIFLLGVF